MAVLVALVRGLARKTTGDDRQLLGRPDPRHALHPAAAVAGARGGPGLAGRRPDVLAVQDRVARAAGHGRRTAKPVTQQTLALGPAASQVAIKQLGTNGGGFFGVNSAHPFENPTPLSNFLEMLAILLIPAALCYTFGRMVGDTRQGWAVLAAMMVIFVPLRSVRRPSSGQSGARRARSRSSRRQHGGQGGPLRHRRLRPLGDGDDRRQQRLGQLDARLVHAARRPGPDVADPARRGRLRRRRVGALRDAGVRDHRRVRRRADGRPDAGVPRQEDRGVRDEDGVARAS